MDLHALMAASGVGAAPDSPDLDVRELTALDELTTSRPLLHKEYLIVGDRIWRFDVAARPGTAYWVEREEALVVGVLGVALALGSGCAVEMAVRRGRLRRDLVVATDLNRDKDRFLLALSHQVRTPLTAVVGFLSVLKTHSDLSPEEQREFIAQAADQADEVAAVVHDILVVTRDDIDLLVVTSEPTNPIREAESVVASVARGSTVIDIHPDLATSPIARADPIRVRQILRNLVNNAIRHGGSQVHISCYRLGSEVVVSVADDGPGLSLDLEEQVRTSGRVSIEPADTHSLGLGLRVAWLLAERMSGRIEYRRTETLTVFELILQPIDESSTSAERFSPSQVSLAPPHP